MLVNLERLRWLPRQLGAASLGNAYVILNVPDFTLRVMQNGAPVWTTRVVTGKPGKHATPMLTETMKFITVNPTWNVPPSIIYNEYLPALQQDPTVLERMGLRLERGRDGSIHISQPPGEANALGRIRFNFPNKFLVYQHDTPDKHLFAKEERAFSHGCMRVQNPDQYASTLLNIVMPNERYSPEKIRSMYGRSEIDLKFPTPIPVNITYQTAFVDDAGKLQISQGHLWPRRHDDRSAQEQPQQGPGNLGLACPAELCAAEGRFAGRRQLRQRQHLLVRTRRSSSACSAARRPRRRRLRLAAGRNSGSPGNRLCRGGFPNEINDLASPARFVYVNHYPSRMQHRALFRHSPRVRLGRAWGRDGKHRLTIPL